MKYQVNVASLFESVNILCFSHLRWAFVYQRPQHVLTHFAKHANIYFFEEPIFQDDKDELQITRLTDKKITIIVPYLRKETSLPTVNERLEILLTDFIRVNHIDRFWSWYYTPMALDFTRNLFPELVIYDCMDELSAFKFAPPLLKQNEKELLEIADIVFTGGFSIYNAKKDMHRNIHPFPSSIDKQHFGRARTVKNEVHDQQNIPYPRFGFFGVVDERLDIGLIRDVAEKRPNWHFIIVGPVVKIDQASLPGLSNIHYLGAKQYEQLPEYLAGWDIAIIPFARNESTRFISPTKTPEYLAGGKPVISTAITDVVDPYGKNGLVHIVHNADDFIEAGESELTKSNKNEWLKEVDAFLENDSWDNTCEKMMQVIINTMKENTNYKKQKAKTYV